MPEIRIPILISGAEALRELDSIAKGTTSSLVGVESASKALQTTSVASSAAITEMTAALRANTAALLSHATGSNQAAAGMTRFAGGTRAVTAELSMMEGKMPIRAAAQLLASMSALAPVMAAAFPIFGAVALAEIVPHITSAIEDGIGALIGYDEQAKKTFAHSLETAEEVRKSWDSVHKAQLEATLAPLSGPAKTRQQIGVNSTLASDQIHQLQKDILELKRLQDQLKEIDPGFLKSATGSAESILSLGTDPTANKIFGNAAGNMVSAGKTFGDLKENIAILEKRIGNRNPESVYASNKATNDSLYAEIPVEEARRSQAAALARSSAQKSIGEAQVRAQETNAKASFELGRTTSDQELSSDLAASQQRLKVEQDFANQQFAIKSQEKGANIALLQSELNESLKLSKMSADQRATELNNEAALRQQSQARAVSLAQANSILKSGQYGVQNADLSARSQFDLGQMSRSEYDQARVADAQKDADLERQNAQTIHDLKVQESGANKALLDLELSQAQAAADHKVEILRQEIDSENALKDRATQREIANVQVEAAKALIERQSSHAQRMAQISMTPGREVQTIQNTYNAQIELADQLFAKEQERIDKETDAGQKKIDRERLIATVTAARDAAEREAQEKIAELQQKRINAARSESDKLFDALDSKNGAGRGLTEFFRAQMKSTERTLFTNLLTMGPNGGIMGGFQRNLGGLIPGQTDGSFMQRLFAGTPLGVQTPPSAMQYQGAKSYVNSDIDFGPTSPVAIQKDNTAKLELNNRYTETNNELMQKWIDLFGGVTTSSSSGSSSGGFGGGSALAVASLLSHIGGTPVPAAVAAGLGTVSKDAAVVGRAVGDQGAFSYTRSDVNRAGFLNANDYDAALQVAEYNARVQQGGQQAGDDLVLESAKAGLAINPATGKAWSPNPEFNDFQRRLIAGGIDPVPSSYVSPVTAQQDSSSTDLPMYPRDPDMMPPSWNRSKGAFQVPTLPKGWMDDAYNKTYPGLGPFNGASDNSGVNKWITSHSNDISAVGAVGGMGLGAYEGFKQGTTKGDLAGSAAIVGGVTSLLENPAIQKAIGAVASSVPIVGGVISAGLAIFSSILGSSAQERRDQMQNEIGGSFDRLPQAQNKQFDITGHLSDITGAGQARSITVINNSPTITAFNSQSIIDNWDSISSAVHMGVQMNHPVVDAIRQAA